MWLNPRGWLCVLVWCALSLPFAVEAQSAAEWFERGQRALAAGKNAEAARAFEAGYAIEPRPEALMFLGLAQTGLGRPDLAEDAYERYVATAPAEAASQVEAVRAELQRLRTANAEVQLRVQPEAARVRVDGAELRAREGRILVAPGLRRFQLEAEGHLPHERRMRVEPGRFALEVRLEPAPITEAVAAPAALPTPAAATGSEPIATPTPAAAAAPAAATATTQPTPAPPPATEELTDPFAEDAAEPAADDRPCLLGDFCFGPVLNLGVANLVGAGLHVRYGWFGLGVDAQFFPEIGLAGGDLSAWLVSVPVRAYLAGPFYVSVGFAYQSITGKLTDPTGTVEATIRVPALTIGIGLLGRSGFVLGIDAQLGIPLGSEDTTVTAPADAPDEVVAQAEDLAHDVADALPVILQINLLRIGYLF